ncbi:NAC domain-containing protein 53 [Lactuca sativa]|uniref:NAC domain-containing protein 53 n=1 Tax=Lactuca sativa TaxID=4236 RepID=UPI000CC4F841|nr:NAC domain-containing protein 53 [Lactuca sativa]
MALSIDSTPVASSLAPGFRFHPTDEELVRYYLRRKICGKPFRFDAISDVDVYKVEPWDLPDLSKLKSRDLEWYFFSALDKKYGNGSRTNRATEKGYWKTTGKDRVVHHRSQQVGMKKTLVYHSGRAPKGERTNWVMHEYRLIDQELEKAGIIQDAFVLCRIFRKSGSGPKNGEKYGAPFIEEEWEDEDESVVVPKQEDCTQELPVDEDSYLDANDIEQILNTDMPVEDVPLPLNFNQDDYSNIISNSDESNKSFDPPVQTVFHEHVEEQSNPMNFDIDYLLDQPYFDATSDFPLDETLFFEANDLKDDVNTDSGLDILDEYMSFYNSDLDNFQPTFDSLQNDNIALDSSSVLKGTHQEQNNDKDIASSSKKEHADQETDIAYPFLKKASYMLENISAPPAFASEFPAKYMASGSHGQSSVNVTSGMIHISNVSFGSGAMDFSLGKNTQLNIVVSFGDMNTGKVNSGGSRSWFYCGLLWILVASLSFKIGSLVCSRSFMS